MAKKFKKPPFYRKNSLTVGMLEHMCSKIPDKMSVVMVADKLGQGVEKCIRAFHQEGPKATPIGLIVCGKFGWNSQDDEGDPTEDQEETIQLTEEQAALVCAYFDADNIEEKLPKGVSYFGGPTVLPNGLPLEKGI